MPIATHRAHGHGTNAARSGGPRTPPGSRPSLAEDPDDANARVLASVKMNLAPTPPSLGLRLVADVGAQPRVEWKGTSPHTAGMLLAVPDDPEERNALDDAREFLRELLAWGRVAAKDGEAAAHAKGISLRTLQRARTRERIEAFQEQRGVGSPWYWRLPNTSGDGGLVKYGTSEQRNPLSSKASAETAKHPEPGATPDTTLAVSGSAYVAQGFTSPADHETAKTAKAVGAAPCPSCGGDVIRWGFGAVCRECKRQIADGPDTVDQLLAANGWDVESGVKS